MSVADKTQWDEAVSRRSREIEEWQVRCRPVTETVRDIRAKLPARPLEERELAKEVQKFEKVFAGGQAGEPDAKAIGRIATRQKLKRKGRHR